MNYNKKTKYAVYRNLNNGQLSIKSQATGLVVGHCQKIILSGVIFKVSKVGIQRIRREKIKSVVAMVVGDIHALEGFVSYKGRNYTSIATATVKKQVFNNRILFDPYKYDGFMDENFNIQNQKDFVEINKSGLMLY